MNRKAVQAGRAILNPARLAALCSLWQRTGREVWITLQGGSMAPTFLPGARLCLRYGPRAVEIGDVIAYRQGSSLVVHRVIAVVPDSGGGGRKFICLGDGNVSPDAPVSEELVAGVVIGAAPAAFWKRTLYSFRHPRRHCRYALRRLTRRIGTRGDDSVWPNEV